MALKVVTPKKQYTSKIKSVTQGKSWTRSSFQYQENTR